MSKKLNPRSFTAPSENQQGRYAGKSIIEMLEDRLDEAYTSLLKYPSNTKLLSPKEVAAKSNIAGRCAGLATAIATMRNPYRPDEDAIRSEVRERHDNG